MLSEGMVSKNKGRGGGGALSGGVNGVDAMMGQLKEERCRVWHGSRDFYLGIRVYRSNGIVVDSTVDYTCRGVCSFCF
jgi:hypothetical protein